MLNYYNPLINYLDIYVVSLISSQTRNEKSKMKKRKQAMTENQRRI